MPVLPPMTDDPDEPRGSCVLCRRRDPFQPQACDGCRSWLGGMLADIRILEEQLHTPPQSDTDRRDPVVVALPAAAIPGGVGGRATNSPESHPPLDLTPLDLTLPARPHTRILLARGALGLDPDQIGDLSIATILDGWVRDWVDVRGLGEQLPAPTVDALGRWLATRVEWACDTHPAVDEFATEIAECRSALRRTLGLIDRPEYKEGVACPKCDTRALYHHNGSDWIECAACPALLSVDEYEATTRAQAKKADTPTVQTPRLAA